MFESHASVSVRSGFTIIVPVGRLGLNEGVTLDGEFDRKFDDEFDDETDVDRVVDAAVAPPDEVVCPVEVDVLELLASFKLSGVVDDSTVLTPGVGQIVTSVTVTPEEHLVDSDELV